MSIIEQSNFDNDTKNTNCAVSFQDNKKKMHRKTGTKRLLTRASALFLAAALLTGCNSTALESLPETSSTMIYPSSDNSSKQPGESAESSFVSSESTAVSEPENSKSSESTSSTGSTTPSFSFEHEPKLPLPEGESFPVCSLSDALANFNAISNKKPEGSPEEIVQTLLERNILCFAAIQGKCWTYGDSTGDDPLIVPIYSDYITSAVQMTELFCGTYTENQAWRLFHPQEVDGYGDIFQYDESGALCFDLDHLRRKHMESFKDPTYAAVVEADDESITFGRYFNITPGDVEPNNMLFKAVKENGEWRLNTYITDAPSFAPLYTELIPTGRVGNPELMEIAKEQVGNIGGEKYWKWYGFSQHMEWCGAFVSWCYSLTGKEEPFFTACNSEGARWFKDHEQWADRDYPDIAPGDSIFFDWDEEGSADHVGLVLGTDGKYVYTIEGNRDDVCITRGYELNSPYILGYGLMDWSE